MRISSLTIRNFRCFHSFTLDIKNSLNILVGENNVGKSSMFLAISKLLKSTVEGARTEIFTASDLRYGKLEEQGLLVQCRLNLNTQEQRQLLDSLSADERLRPIEKNRLYERLKPILETAEVAYTREESRSDTYVKLGPMFVQNSRVSHSLGSSGSTSEHGSSHQCSLFGDGHAGSHSA